MATSINAARVGATFIADFISSLDIGLADYKPSWSPDYTFTNGTGANQANMVFTDTRTLSASATEDLDVAGGLTDVFGNTITMTKIRALVIQAASGNTNNVLVGGAAAAIDTIFGAVGDYVIVRPGGLLVLVAPDATGYAITATTADDLKIANSAGSTSVTYTIAILGTV